MRKKVADVILHTCRQCAKSTEWQNKALDGHYILCRCPHHKYMRFLDRDGCNDNYRPRK